MSLVKKRRSAAGPRRGNAVLKKESNVCLDCEATCCRDLAVMITRPRTRDEIDALKWQLHFDTVRVFIRNRRWHVLTKGKCIFLSPENLCTNYEERSEICRDHQPPDCERYGEFYEVLIETPEELETHLARPRKG